MRHTRKLIKTNKRKNKLRIRSLAHKKRSVKKHTTKKRLNMRPRASRRMNKKVRRTRRHMKGGNLSGSSIEGSTGANDTVAYKVGSGVSAGNLPNGQNHYALNPTSLLEPNGSLINTSLHTAVHNQLLSNQAGGNLMKLMPQDLVNLGRSVIGNATGVYDNWVGQTPDASHNVMDQPINKSTPPEFVPIDMNTITSNSDVNAAQA